MAFIMHKPSHLSGLQMKIYGAGTTNILSAAALLVLFQLKGKGLAWLAMKPERFVRLE